MMMIVFSAVGLALVVATAVRVMKRSNSRAAAIMLGTLVAPLPTIAGAVVEALIAPAAELRTGLGFALGLGALYLAVAMTTAGAVIAAAIAFAMNEGDPEDAYLKNLEDDLNGRR